MADFSALLSIPDRETDIDLHVDTLAALVESQIANVVGGGYSQYYIWHNKDTQ